MEGVDEDDQEENYETPPRLNYLDITDCISVDDQSLKKFVRQFGAQLSQFYARRCSRLTDSGLRAVARFCPLLREVSLNDCPQLTDFTCFELSSRLGASLRYLSLAKCIQMSDSGLKQVARFCYKLRYLNVRGCEAVSDEGSYIFSFTTLGISFFLPFFSLSLSPSLSYWTALLFFA